MRVSFGSTYSINYDYRLYKAYGFASKNLETMKFINSYNKHFKTKDSISAFNPKNKTYYLKIPNTKDIDFETYAKTKGIHFKKVNKHYIENSIITSVGKSKDEAFQIGNIIAKYEENKRFKENYLR